MRLDPINVNALTPEQAALHDTLTGGRDRRSRSASLIADEDGVVRGPFTVMLHHPELGVTLEQVGAVLRFGGLLSDRARELVILIVAVHWNSDFEWWAHEPIARRAGVTDPELDAVRHGTELTLADPVEQAAVDAARTLLRHADLDDTEYQRAEAALGSQQMIEVSALVGYYAMLALQMRLFRITAPAPPPDDEAGA